MAYSDRTNEYWRYLLQSWLFCRDLAGIEPDDGRYFPPSDLQVHVSGWLAQRERWEKLNSGRNTLQAREAWTHRVLRYMFSAHPERIDDIGGLKGNLADFLKDLRIYAAWLEHDLKSLLSKAEQMTHTRALAKQLRLSGKTQEEDYPDAATLAALSEAFTADSERLKAKRSGALEEEDTDDYNMHFRRFPKEHFENPPAPEGILFVAEPGEGLLAFLSRIRREAQHAEDSLKAHLRIGDRGPRPQNLQRDLDWTWRYYVEGRSITFISDRWADEDETGGDPDVVSKAVKATAKRLSLVFPR